MNNSFSTMPIPEFYNTFNGPSEWVLKGYDPPKTCLFGSRDAGINKDRRKNFTETFAEQKKFIDPIKYSETLEQSEKKYWNHPSGTFCKEKRETLTAKAMKRSRSLPGPGSYFKDKKGEYKKKTGFKFGKFDKSEKSSFLQNTIALSQQTPSSWKYHPDKKNKSRFTNPLYHNPIFVKKFEKVNNGPGFYHENSEKAIKKQILPASFTFQFSKLQTKHFTTQKALQNKFVPPPGSYPAAEKFNTITHLFEKKKPPISKYKFERFTEKTAKSMAWIPGPGAYNIDRKPKVYRTKE